MPDQQSLADEPRENRPAMRLVIDLDLSRLPNDPAREASRILRYWAGALLQMELETPAEYPLMDSNYDPAGSLQLVEVSAAEPE